MGAMPLSASLLDATIRKCVFHTCTALLVVASLFFASCSEDAHGPVGPDDSFDSSSQQAGWIVQYAAPGDAEALAQKHGSPCRAVCAPARIAWFDDVSETMRNDEAVVTIEPNWVVRPEEEVYGNWEHQVMEEIQGELALEWLESQPAWFGTRLSQAHSLSRGTGIRIGILDTGIDPAHPILTATHALGNGQTHASISEQRNGIDDDGDGLVDAAFGHGTHVAGIIHAVAPDATIIAYRVLNEDGYGTLFSILSGLEQARADGVRIVNMSLSMSSSSEMLSTLLTDLNNDGVYVVCAAGNSGDAPRFPATETSTLSVAALNSSAWLADFSARGTVDLGAPGVDIVSSFPGGSMARASGTSMAAPFVSGSLALLLAADIADPVSALLGTSAPAGPAGVVGAGCADPAAALGL